MTERDGIPKYARLECERRWLVSPAALSGVARDAGWLIEDRYFLDTRLRLRRMTPLAGGEPVYKLGKKYLGDGLAAPITNLYLTAAEYATLVVLPGNNLRKWRTMVHDEGVCFAIDEFAVPLAGLVIAECELTSPDAVAAVTPPAWAGPEITDCPALSGAALAATDFAQLRPLLAALLTGASAYSAAATTGYFLPRAAVTVSGA